jgi:hypothetical protein
MAWQGSSGPNGVMQTPGGIFYDLGSGIRNLLFVPILNLYFYFLLSFRLFTFTVSVISLHFLYKSSRCRCRALHNTSHVFIPIQFFIILILNLSLLLFVSLLLHVFTGTGKVVMAATVLHPFSECTGIEILNGLHCVAVELLSCFQDKVLPKMAKRERNTSMRVCVCVCVKGGCVCV